MAHVDTMKDCDCLTHDGPHWLHMDALDRERNRELLQQALQYERDRNFPMWAATLQCYAWHESQRLLEKALKVKVGEAFALPKVSLGTESEKGKA